MTSNTISWLKTNNQLGNVVGVGTRRTRVGRGTKTGTGTGARRTRGIRGTILLVRLPVLSIHLNIKSLMNK